MTPPQKRPPAPFPLTVVTGFLGAGKTSLLNALLRDPALGGTLVIVNEFGEIGLDHLLVERLDGDMLVMTSGCLCCSIRGDLIATLEDILRRRDNGRIAPFQRVMIETTGLADPAPVLHTIMAHPYLMLRFRVDGVVTLVDAVNGTATLDAHEEAVKQAAMADRLVLSKTDLLTAGSGALRDLRARLKRLNPGAVLLDAAKGEATARALLDAGIYDPDRKIPDVRRWLNAEAFAARGADDHSAHVSRHPHGDGSHGEGEKHYVNRHDARIRAFCMRHEAPLAPAALDLFLELLRRAHGPRLLRIKGIVALGDDPSRPVVIQGVQHVFHPPLRLPAWPDADHGTRMVFILRDMEPSFVEALWLTLTGLVEPGGAALAVNPLAPPKDGFFA
ncbi:MAG: CobW family GTP-binding protein [Methylocella sp.]|nr:MAG: GTP-binding protein [Hyphomicrobiales bacterium]